MPIFLRCEETTANRLLLERCLTSSSDRTPCTSLTAAFNRRYRAASTSSAPLWDRRSEEPAEATPRYRRSFQVAVLLPHHLLRRTTNAGPTKTCPHLQALCVRYAACPLRRSVPLLSQCHRLRNQNNPAADYIFGYQTFPSIHQPTPLAMSQPTTPASAWNPRFRPRSPRDSLTRRHECLAPCRRRRRSSFSKIQ